MSQIFAGRVRLNEPTNFNALRETYEVVVSIVSALKRPIFIRCGIHQARVRSPSPTPRSQHTCVICLLSWLPLIKNILSGCLTLRANSNRNVSTLK